MNRSVIESGLVLELDGKFWGVVHEDSHSKSHGWTDIKNADISDPRYVGKPSDKTYQGSPYIDEMNKGRLIMIKIVTSYEILSPSNHW